MKFCRHSIPLWLPVLLITLFQLCGCAPKITDVEAPITEPAEFTYSGEEVIPEKWWTSFKDPILNTLVDSAFSDNLNLASIWEQFQAARAMVKTESSFLWPEVEASLRSGISRPEPDFAGGENLQAGLSTSYELDLWGRIRSGVEAEEFRAQATYYDYQAAAMTLSAEISMIWYQLVATRNQLALINDQIQTNENLVRLIRARFTGGQVSAVDIMRQEQLLESTLNQKITYQTDIILLKNQLAVLLGQAPQNAPELTGETLPELPPLPTTGLPLELVRRRPDVQQAYNLVLAADRDMAQAISSKYPRLSLNFAAEMRSNNYDSLFQDWAYTLAGDLIAPLLYWGRLRAEVERTEALKNQWLYQYGQTVLNAFREVEDALIREKQQEERLLVLQRQLELSKKTNRQLRMEFLNGLSEYIDVLLSLEQEQQLQRNFIQAKLEQLENRINLYRALAGAFSTQQSEVP